MRNTKKKLKAICCCCCCIWILSRHFYLNIVWISLSTMFIMALCAMVFTENSFNAQEKSININVVISTSFCYFVDTFLGVVVIIPCNFFFLRSFCLYLSVLFSCSIVWRCSTLLITFSWIMSRTTKTQQQQSKLLMIKYLFIWNHRQNTITNM